MNHYAESTGTETYAPQTTPVFRLLVVYDSHEASAIASATSDFVIHELGGDIPVDKTFWSACLLDNPENLQTAANQAAAADLLIVAVSNENFSPAVRRWSEQWQQQRTLEGGLLAVLPQDGREDSRDWIEYLREAAICSNMDFLCRRGERKRF